jgi:basic membrane protein A and related proteins
MVWALIPMPANSLLRSTSPPLSGIGGHIMGPYYVEAVKQVRAGTWKSTDQWWPISTGIVGLSPLGPTVADTLKNLVEERKQDLIAGRFDVFWGPIKDQSGKLRIAAGEKPVDEILLGMD